MPQRRDYPRLFRRALDEVGARPFPGHVRRRHVTTADSVAVTLRRRGRRTTGRVLSHSVINQLFLIGFDQSPSLHPNKYAEKSQFFPFRRFSLPKK